MPPELVAPALNTGFRRTLDRFRPGLCLLPGAVVLAAFAMPESMRRGLTA